MLQLINASEQHSQQILHYFSITCFWKEFVENNKLNQSYSDFMLEWIILPRIPITKVLVKPSDPSTIYGCLIAATTDEFSKMPDYTPHLDSKVLEVFSNWFAYPISEGIILELYAIDNQFKKKGYGKLMLTEVDNIALHQNKDIISCFVWNCFHDSIVATTKHQFTVVDCLTFTNPIDIKLLYMEKNINYINKVDYFQSEEYKNITQLLYK